MGLFDFLAMMVGAIILTLVFMVIGEKLISKILRGNGSPFIRIVGSFIFAIAILSVLMFGMGKAIGFYACLLSGIIILFNKYWFGHFSVETRTDSTS